MPMNAGHIEVTLVHVEGGTYEATECSRCAALIRTDKQAKHEQACGNISRLNIHDLVAALESDRKHTVHRGHTRH